MDGGMCIYYLTTHNLGRSGNAINELMKLGVESLLNSNAVKQLKKMKANTTMVWIYEIYLRKYIREFEKVVIKRDIFSLSDQRCRKFRAGRNPRSPSPP
jgi:hypothetical protein